MHAIYDVNNYLWSTVEEALTPLPKGSKDSKLVHMLPALALVPGLVTGCVAAVAHMGRALFCPKQLPDPRECFSSVCKDSRLWKKLGDLEPTLGNDDPDFLLGVATSTFQDSGAVNCPDSQWVDWENKHLPKENRSQESANLFKLYQTPEGRKEITDRLKQLGVNSYRFSVEMSHFSTSANKNREVMQVYVDFCKHLRNEGIEPMVTLHHFSEHKVFHAMGSFEKEENIQYFVDFAKEVFTALTIKYRKKPLVEYFCTINEPTVEASLRYITGEFSPGEKGNVEKAAIFLKTMLKAHMRVYDVLKKINPKVKIGIVHQQMRFLPKYPFLYPFTRYMDKMTDAVLRFFREGTFEVKIPFTCNVSEKGFKPKTDFVGLQYYARQIIGPRGPTSLHEPMTLMPWREDPEGLYETIVEAHGAFKAPIIVTENGISTHDDVQRSRYIERALYAAQKAQEVIGRQNLRGYYVWAFCDNSEWMHGLDPQKFGAYAVEKTDSGRQIAADPKPGMAPFIKLTAKRLSS